MLVSVQTKQKNTSASAFENAGNGSLDLTFHVSRSTFAGKLFIGDRNFI
jgi:hypothetical protein